MKNLTFQFRIKPTQETSTGIDEIQQEEKKTYYSTEEIGSLGTFEEFEGVKVVLPHSESYQKLYKIPMEEYSVERGNPLSDFFVASVLTQGTAIVGYLIGQYYNQQQDTTIIFSKIKRNCWFLGGKSYR